MFLVEFDVVQYVRRTAVGPVMSLHTLCLARCMSLCVWLYCVKKNIAYIQPNSSPSCGGLSPHALERQPNPDLVTKIHPSRHNPTASRVATGDAAHTDILRLLRKWRLILLLSQGRAAISAAHASAPASRGQRRRRCASQVGTGTRGSAIHGEKKQRLRLGKVRPGPAL